MRRLAFLMMVAGGCASTGDTRFSGPGDLPPQYTPPSVTIDESESGSLSGAVRHDKTEAPLGNALIVLQSRALSRPREMVTDEYGRYRFAGLPQGTYTVQVLVGNADASKVIDLPEDATFRANFNVDPQRKVVRHTLLVRVVTDESLFSVTDAREARLLGVPRTIYKY